MGTPGCIQCPEMEQFSRRTFLKLGASAGGAGIAGALGVSLHEPHEVTLEHVAVHLPRWPRQLDGFRLVQISDIHFDRYTHAPHLHQAVQTINAQAPDLVVVTGDFVTAPGHFYHDPMAAQKAWPAAEVLAGIDARYGRWAVLGNHDMFAPDIVVEALTAHKLPVLRNAAVPVEAGPARFWLGGLDDIIHGKPDPAATLQKVPREECVIAAAHEPDYADVLSRYAIDFQISGHSHGGQIRLPAIGALYLPPLGRKYVMGSYRVRDLQLYVNRGIGVILLPMRFLCPPEVTVFTLHAGPAL